MAGSLSPKAMRRETYAAESVPDVIPGRAPKAVTRFADASFRIVAQQIAGQPHKDRERKKHWRQLVRAGQVASHRGCAISYERHKSKCPIVKRQVIDGAVSAGMFSECRSPRGSFLHQRSRLVPAQLWRDLCDLETTPDKYADAIELRAPKVKTANGKSKKRRKLKFDPFHPVAVEYGRKLDLINAVNRQPRITFVSPANAMYPEDREYRIDPTLKAKFTGDFDQHGRMYSGPLGHQWMSEKTRATICFDGGPSVELDYSAMLPRMLYHTLGVDFAGDPYALWRDDTTESQRLLAKLVVIVAINTRSRRSAIRACVQKSRLWMKSGKALRKAKALRRALKETGLTFGQVYDLAAKVHAPIAEKYFGRGIGLWTMRLDSEVALNVMYHFAQRNIPCLGIHDSFVVPRRHKAELRRVMLQTYRDKFGFNPVIK